jgi:hypothetical protein
VWHLMTTFITLWSVPPSLPASSSTTTSASLPQYSRMSVSEACIDICLNRSTHPPALVSESFAFVSLVPPNSCLQMVGALLVVESGQSVGEASEGDEAWRQASAPAPEGSAQLPRWRSGLTFTGTTCLTCRLVVVMVTRRKVQNVFA